MAQINNVSCYKGEAVTITAAPLVQTNITGWTLLATFKEKPGDNAALLTVPGVITDAPNGIFTVSLTSTQTKTTLGTGLLYWDIFRTNAGSETALSVGRFEIKQDPHYGV